MGRLGLSVCVSPSSPHVVDLLCSQGFAGQCPGEGVHRVHKWGEGLGWARGRALEGGARDTKRYKETRYSLEVIGLVGGVGVEVLRHR
jgi:hypothetical protein